MQVAGGLKAFSTKRRINAVPVPSQGHQQTCKKSDVDLWSDISYQDRIRCSAPE